MSAADRTEARLRHGRECHEGVTRKGEFQPCDKPAIALRDSREDDAYYPVCAYHARGFCLPLVDPDDAAALVAALRAVLDLADYWATQSTDYDKDTEQQIDDGKAILRAIEEALS